MLEKNFQTKFKHWLEHHWLVTAAFELKITNDKFIYFSRLEVHQKEALLAAKHSKIYHKIPDAGDRNPFDCFILAQIPAYVVVFFYERGQKEFVMVDIDSWVEEEKESKRKSLTEERARQIGLVNWLGSPR